MTDLRAAQQLFSLLTCPSCREGELLGLNGALVDGTITCGRCDAAYEVRGGIPILLPGGTDPASSTSWTDEKRRQAGYYEGEIDTELEIERPTNTPRAHAWLLSQKLERSLEGLPSLAGSTVVNACCGSGMEAEFLARSGARVLAIDLSEGCARRARERARRHGVDYLVVVGDAERLPVRTGAADIAYVHDGLHHLADPLVGVRELARVAKQAVSINEPADALLTRVAVRVGVATDLEEAGNLVARLRPQQIREELRQAGFRVHESRYLMYYRHEPGKPMAIFSHRVLFPLFQAGMATANLALGGMGNKLCVVGWRSAHPGAFQQGS